MQSVSSALLALAVYLYRNFRAHLSAHGTTGTFFWVACNCREKAALVESFPYNNQAVGTGLDAVGAALALLGMYNNPSLHFTFSRSSSACFRDISVMVPLSMRAISSWRSFPERFVTSTWTLSLSVRFEIFR